MKIVIDTNVIVSAIHAGDSVSRDVLRLAFLGEVKPLISNALFLEYEAITQRTDVMQHCHFTQDEAQLFLDSLFSVSQWVEIYFTWRPNLQDEGDNFLIELAIAGNAQCIITKNIKDLKRGELLFPQLSVYTPQQFMTNWRSQK